MCLIVTWDQKKILHNFTGNKYSNAMLWEEETKIGWAVP